MVSISKIIENNQLKSYFILTFLITWTFFCLPFFFSLNDPLFNILLMAIGGSGPAFAAIILSAVIKPQKLETQSLKRWISFLIVLAIVGFLIISYLQITLNVISIPIIILILINAAIAAYIISGGLASRKGIRELLSKLYMWKVDLKWYVIALVLYPAIMFICLFIGSAVTGISLDEVWPQLSMDAVFWFIISCGFIGLVRGPLREEIGWRGFALPRLQYLYSPLVGTLILALIWTFWHLPLHINGIYPGGIEGFYSRCTWNIGLTFLFTWIYNHSRGSLLLTTLFHTSINTAGTLIIIPMGMDGIWSLTYIAFINLAAILVIVADKMWHKLPADSEAVYKY